MNELKENSVRFVFWVTNNTHIYQGPFMIDIEWYDGAFTVLPNEQMLPFGNHLIAREIKDYIFSSNVIDTKSYPDGHKYGDRYQSTIKTGAELVEFLDLKPEFNIKFFCIDGYFDADPGGEIFPFPRVDIEYIRKRIEPWHSMLYYDWDGTRNWEHDDVTAIVDGPDFKCKLESIDGSNVMLPFENI
ncbi:hypothetical protein Sd1_gp25 [Shigella phage Sd1]|uniref:Uncharacterized protein n=1 Tax=Shigella phage Sd1 TaxID=2024313 RepID=A0A291AYL3_9CAUD|nr:hypothetical protein HOR98_gp24 [Shigella phage Sd1]ATE86091.1 hypothetical protein Sd1_gp25 [Shigella phage Sd1]